MLLLVDGGAGGTSVVGLVSGTLGKLLVTVISMILGAVTISISHEELLVFEGEGWTRVEDGTTGFHSVIGPLGWNETISVDVEEEEGISSRAGVVVRVTVSSASGMISILGNEGSIKVDVERIGVLTDVADGGTELSADGFVGLISFEVSSEVDWTMTGVIIVVAVAENFVW